MKHIIMTALVVGLSLGNFACGGKSSSDNVQITGIRLTIRFDPTVLTLDHVRIEGYDTQDSTEVFPAGELPQTASGILTSGMETAVILLPDNLSGREILIKVWGKKGQDITAYGNTTVVLERGVITDAEVNLDAPPVCGDGTVTQVEEICDTAIPQGQSGACPQDCDDQDVCTTDTMNAPNTCQASCHHATIKTCIHGDGCCPDGCEPATDSDCAAVCGDGLIGEGETCDTGISPGQAGACPTDCDDGNPCTTDKLVGQGSCQAHCTSDPVTDFVGGDNCCPQGGTSLNDTDCPITCGNGAQEAGEQCDVAIPAGQLGACPTNCDDSDPCTTDTLYDEDSCEARCGHQVITDFVAGDSCCPEGANSTQDSDCPAVCGNEVVEEGETCDASILTGPGTCPQTASDCDDQLSCTIDSVAHQGTCQAVCQNTPIVSCQDNDGCCPENCTDSTDNDCAATPTCGNGAVDSDETCDIAISQGQPGACPTSCDDSDPCTTDTLVGDGTCEAHCTNDEIACTDGDGCCPTGCNNNTDDDCAAVCGNGVVEPNDPINPETCDTGIPAEESGSCPTSCSDGEACTSDTLTGTGCQIACAYDPITSCTSNDGCCPSDCSLANDGDLDCPGCGNARLETNLGEECDDGNAANLDGCTTSCTTQSGQIGDPCNSSNDCNSMLTCLTGSSVPGGYCSQKDCIPSVTPCPDNAVCTDQLTTGPTSACAEPCQADTDCRWNEDYKCRDAGNGNKACLPD